MATNRIPVAPRAARPGSTFHSARAALATPPRRRRGTVLLRRASILLTFSIGTLLLLYCVIRLADGNSIIGPALLFWLGLLFFFVTLKSLMLLAVGLVLLAVALVQRACDRGPH
jgi:hypothetical protein